MTRDEMDAIHRIVDGLRESVEAAAALVGADELSDTERESESDWTHFLAEHPELGGFFLRPGDDRGAWMFRNQPESGDRDKVLAALRRALAEKPQGVRVGDVMRELWGEDASPEEASIVGNTLFALYRKGLVSRSKEARPSRLWTLPAAAKEASDDAVG